MNSPDLPADKERMWARMLKVEVRNIFETNRDIRDIFLQGSLTLFKRGRGVVSDWTSHDIFREGDKSRKVNWGEWSSFELRCGVVSKEQAAFPFDIK